MKFPFRVGTTSYILADDLLPNAVYLARHVQDMELVLFDLEDGQSNLPEAATVRAMAGLRLSYTVHLPLDLRLELPGEGQHLSLVKARKVIDCTRALNPWAYVAHLDGREMQGITDPQRLVRWQSQACRALEQVLDWLGDADLLALENLEGYPLDFWEPFFERLPVSRCVDVGHLWRDGHDPLPVLKQALPRTRVIHLHGLEDGRDHQSLAHTHSADLDGVLGTLLAARYAGVVTLELFGESDFTSSMQALDESLRRIRMEDETCQEK